MKSDYDYSFSGGVSSSGTLGLDLYFPAKSPTKKQKETALADALRQSRNFMLQNGYLPPDARFMSPTDVAKQHGFTRQYWEKLVNEGKIPFRETSAGRITTDLWVQGYINNKDSVDQYIRNRNKAVEQIMSLDKAHGMMACPNCTENRFDYNRNSNTVNGLCRAGCGFKIHTLSI